MSGNEDDMPGGDRTGPVGRGVTTGPGRGWCRAAGAGRRSGGGRRRGWRHGACGRWQGPTWHEPPDPDAERSLLETEEAALRAELASVQRRLAELSASDPSRAHEAELRATPSPPALAGCHTALGG